MTENDWHMQAEVSRTMLDLFASLVLEMRSAQKYPHGTYAQYERMVELEHRIDEWLAAYAAGKGR